MSILCRIGWHAWTRWEKGLPFIDTSYGLDAPMREYLAECRRCSKPRRMSQMELH